MYCVSRFYVLRSLTHFLIFKMMTQMFSIKQLQSKLVPPIQSLAAVSSSTFHSETRGPHLSYTEHNL